MVQDHLQLIFGSSAIFNALEPSDRERLKSAFTPRSFDKNEIIFQKGDPGFGLYLIRCGKIKICVTDCHGAELIFTFLSQGDLLGELSILDGQPRSATAVAVESTDTWYLDRREFNEFLRSSPQACSDIIMVLCQRLRRVSTQVEELSFLDVSGRLARRLTAAIPAIDLTESSGQKQVFALSITQEELAKEIGATREMVNKILNSFVDLGLIIIARKKLTIRDIAGLNRLASYEGDDKSDISLRPA